MSREEELEDWKNVGISTDNTSKALSTCLFLYDRQDKEALKAFLEGYNSFCDKRNKENIIKEENINNNDLFIDYLVKKKNKIENNIKKYIDDYEFLNAENMILEIVDIENKIKFVENNL